MRFFGSHRLAGFQSATTLKNLTLSIILELEQSMRSFPDLLAKYTESNNIQLTITDELQIFGCFQDGAFIAQTNIFGDFAFRNGDKNLLLHVVELINEKIKFERREQDGSLSVIEDYSFFKFCNPNAAFSNISTIVGNFHGGEDINNMDNTDDLKGVYINCIYLIILHYQPHFVQKNVSVQIN